MAPCNFSTAEVAILLNNPNMDSAAGQKFPEEGKRPTIDRQRLGQSGQRWRNYCSQVELFYWFFIFFFCLLFFLEFIAWLIPCFHHIFFPSHFILALISSTAYWSILEASSLLSSLFFSLLWHMFHFHLSNDFCPSIPSSFLQSIFNPICLTVGKCSKRLSKPATARKNGRHLASIFVVVSY